MTSKWQRIKEIWSPQRGRQESNSLFGNQVLANQLLTGGGQGQWQLLYTTISDSTAAGQPVDITRCTRNSTIVACMNWKARSFAQMTPKVMYYNDDLNSYEDALTSKKISKVDRARARSVQNLLKKPNNFQSTYEFLAQCSMWLDLTGELFILNWRNNQTDQNEPVKEMYVMDTTLMTARVNAQRYPTYRNSGPMYGFGKETEFSSAQITHVMEGPWQGASGFNKLIQAAELVNLSQAIDEYANFVLKNAAKPSSIFTSDQQVPIAKKQEIAQQLKETWAVLVGSRDTDPSKPGQTMLLDAGFKFSPINPPTLSDMQTQQLKQQVDQRICGLMGVPSLLVGIGQDTKFNNSQILRDEAYKSTLAPLLKMLSTKLDMALFTNYPNLKIDWDVSEFLKGAVLEQMQYAAAGVGAGIFTQNEARSYLNKPMLDGMDVLMPISGHAEPDGDEDPSKTKDNQGNLNIAKSGQDTGGGGGGTKVTDLRVVGGKK